MASLYNIIYLPLCLLVITINYSTYNKPYYKIKTIHVKCTIIDLRYYVTKCHKNLRQFHQFVVGDGEHVEVEPRVEHALLFLGCHGERVEPVATLIDSFVHDFHEDHLSPTLAVFFGRFLPLCFKLRDDMLQILFFYSLLWVERGRGVGGKGG